MTIYRRTLEIEVPISARDHASKRWLSDDRDGPSLVGALPAILSIIVLALIVGIAVAGRWTGGDVVSRAVECAR